MATAVGTVAVIVDAAMIVLVRLIVSEVTASAVRLVNRRRPDHDVRVVGMALGSGEIAPVIQRLVGQSHVLVDMRGPGVRRMAVIAFMTGYKMPRIFASRGVAVVT